jgi:hypothetical protein
MGCGACWQETIRDASVETPVRVFLTVKVLAKRPALAKPKVDFTDATADRA